MAKESNLSSLVHELRERVAASASTPANNLRHSSGDEEDALEIRFRDVFPNLLNTYVVPSLGNYCLSCWIVLELNLGWIGFSIFSPILSGNGREVTAVLKLVGHTARNIPGVFYHGNPCAILPVIARIIPFFAQPEFV